MKKTPIATVGCTHTCPMTSSGNPHVGGAITGPGCQGILIDGRPLSVLSDQCLCIGAVDSIIEGCKGILANGKPIVLLGCHTTHGGIVTEGIVGVSVSTIKETDSTIPVSANSGEHQKKENALIYNLRWIKNENVTAEEFVSTKVHLMASVLGIKDGESVTISVQIPDEDESGKIVTFEAIVKDGEVDVEMDLENYEEVFKQKNQL